jgi:hypothetical protein
MSAAPSGTRRLAAAVAALCGIAFVAVAADHPGRRAPVQVELRVRRAAEVRARDGRTGVRVAVRCSEETTGEIAGVLEQHAHGELQRATRIIDIPCGPQWLRLELAFEGAHFVAGPARLNVDAMAGFAEDFGQTHVRVVSHLHRAPSRR